MTAVAGPVAGDGHDLLALVRRLGGHRVVVVGDAMVDSFLEGRGRGLCREAPVPAVELDHTEHRPGGAANTAVNLAALGADVALVGAVGDDADGRTLRALLAGAGVDVTGVVTDPERRTVAKRRLVADGHLLARLDEGTTTEPGAPTRGALAASAAEAVAGAAAVVLSDYGCGTVGDAVRHAVADGRRRGAPGRPPAPVVVDAHDASAHRSLGPTVATPSYAEALALAGARPQGRGAARADQVLACAATLFERTGAEQVVVTLDRDGALLLERDGSAFRTYARPAPDSHATGAGDTFTAALALGLAAGAPPRAAVELASLAAGVVTGEPQTAVCTAAALAARLAGGTRKLVELDELARQVDDHRRAGRRIVFTNGCFDLLHRGHVGYLSRAKALGDVLVVAVNDDAGTRRLKGPGRPVAPLADRVNVVSALSCVDLVVTFAGDSPVAALEAVRPHLYVKGGDHRRASLPEVAVVERLGGTVHLLPHEPGATGRLLDQIRHGGGLDVGAHP